MAREPAALLPASTHTERDFSRRRFLVALATTTAAAAVPRAATAAVPSGVQTVDGHVRVDCLLHHGALDRELSIVADLRPDGANGRVCLVAAAKTESQIGIESLRAAIEAARRGESSALPTNAPASASDPTPASSDLAVTPRDDRIRFTTGTYWVELPQARAEEALAALATVTA